MGRILTADAGVAETDIDEKMESDIRLTAYKNVLAKGGCNG